MDGIGHVGASEPPGHAAYKQIEAQIERTEIDPRPVVVMTCGISGAGKSTLSKRITAVQHNFTRLSIDALIYDHHGLYGIDYPSAMYAQYQDEARQRLQTQLMQILQEGTRDVVLDLSFWNKNYRDEYRVVVEQGGGRAVLVFLDAEKDVLWRQIMTRKARRDLLDQSDSTRDGDSAYEVSKETFEAYLAGFEKPIGEGEIVVKVK